MMMFKVYQLQKLNIRVEDNKYKYDVAFNVIAEYTVNSGTEVEINPNIVEDVWDSCNVDCWKSDWTDGASVDNRYTHLEPTKYFIGHVNSDIIVETDEGLYLAEMCGWTKIPDMEYGIYKIITSDMNVSWESIQNKDDLQLTEDKLNSYRERFDQDEQNGTRC